MKAAQPDGGVTMAKLMTPAETAATLRVNLPELPAAADVLGRLALEAEFRGMKLPELIAHIIAATAEKDLFQVALA